MKHVLLHNQSRHAALKIHKSATQLFHSHTVMDQEREKDDEEENEEEEKEREPRKYF